MSQNSSNIPFQDLIVTLEQATSMARQLPTTSDPTLLHQLYSTLHQANRNISTFLAAPPPPPHPPAVNSHSSSTGADPMQVERGGGEEELEANSRNTAVDRVEEGMRNCFIRNKRLKRRLSPAAADVIAFREDADGARGYVGFDPFATRRRARDLVSQFHI